MVVIANKIKHVDVNVQTRKPNIPCYVFKTKNCTLTEKENQRRRGGVLIIIIHTLQV